MLSRQSERFLCLFQWPYNLRDPGLLFHIRVLGIGSPAVTTVLWIPVVLSYNPFSAIDTSLGKSPLRLGELELGLLCFRCLPGFIKIIYFNASLVNY